MTRHSLALILAGITVFAQAAPVLANGRGRGKQAARGARARARAGAEAGVAAEVRGEPRADAHLGRSGAQARAPEQARAQARAARRGELVRSTVTARGENIRVLSGGRRIPLEERREIAIEAVRERILSEGRLPEGRQLQVYADMIDPAASANPITGDGLITVQTRERPAGRFDRYRRQRAFVSVSADGSEVRILAVESLAPQHRVARSFRALRVNELVSDVVASEGVRTAVKTAGVGAAAAGVGASSGDLTTTGAGAAAGTFLLKDAWSSAWKGVARRKEARRESLTDAIRWAKEEGLHGQGYPTLGDTYARYQHTLESRKPGTRPAGIVRFADTLRREWNSVTVDARR